jgi:hypothetical protein
MQDQYRVRLPPRHRRAQLPNAGKAKHHALVLVHTQWLPAIRRMGCVPREADVVHTSQVLCAQ